MSWSLWCNLELKCYPCTWNLEKACFEGNISWRLRSFVRRNLELYQAGDVVCVIKIGKILISVIYLRTKFLHYKLLTYLKPLYLICWLLEYPFTWLRSHCSLPLKYVDYVFLCSLIEWFFISNSNFHCL